MKFIVDNSHREFFQVNGWIEFEEVLSEDTCTALLAGIERVLRKRGAPKRQTLPEDALNSFIAGRDVWRDDPELKKTIGHRLLAEIVSEIVEVKPLRLAYDQFLQPETQGCLPDNAPFGSLGPCQGMLAIVAICLQGTGEGVLPSQPGHISVIQPTTLLTASPLQGAFLLIGYCRAVARFAVQPLDPCTHLPKTQGYATGDRLVDRLHPIVYR